MTQRIAAPQYSTQTLLFSPDDSDAQRLRERAEAILWVKSQMARHGVHLEDLVAVGCFSEPSSPASKEPRVDVQYKDAYGHTWDGNGVMPDWLQRAINAGQSADHFRVA